LLDSHPQIHARFDDITEVKDKGADYQLEMAAQYLTPPLVGRHRVVGFKTKPANILDRDRFTELLYEHQCRIIYLLRRNRVKSVVSHLNGKRLAAKTGMWGLYDEANRPDSFSIDPIEFDETLKHREKVEGDLSDYIHSLKLPLLTISYEDLLVKPDELLSKTQTFLGVEPQPLKAGNLKITSDDLRDVLDNFDELRARYVGTQYEAMFDEVLIR
jgi:LPS sulfotransferase NodH